MWPTTTFTITIHTKAHNLEFGWPEEEASSPRRRRPALHVDDAATRVWTPFLGRARSSVWRGVWCTMILEHLAKLQAARIVLASGSPRRLEILNDILKLCDHCHILPLHRFSPATTAGRADSLTWQTPHVCAC